MKATSRLDPRVESLVLLDVDDIEPVMLELQRDLHGIGGRRIAAMLRYVFSSREIECDARALALETLAASRAGDFKGHVREMVLEAISSNLPTLQFAGIASASDLTLQAQVGVSRVVRALLEDQDLDDAVRSAGESFLKATEKRRELCRT